ncbi:transcription factor TFC4/TFIIC-102/sfc4 [Babesia gibsoni]|uniref:Transcription factor TFC4/TFIIC-102/sfc4 n=1 Tax=Babesia gibsoni TaxID=33632 RepID=A0AAD8LQP1_BABGI|nr:transcription factor TFC4/TFIIC-102/sfc4 [Babesia gibsoni]
MDEYIRRERLPLDLIDDDEPVGECSDAEVDEEELNSFLMGDVLSGSEPKKKRKLSFADKLLKRKLKKGKKGKTPPPPIPAIPKQKKKKKRKTAAHPSKLTPQLEKYMQDAMNMYLNENFEEAIKILKEVVRRAPGLHDPFHLLGLIYQEEYGDITTATGYYLLAAHLVQTDLELWRRIGEMSQEIGNIDQAIYCYKKCMKTDDGEPNEEVTFSLAMCYLQKNDYQRAIKLLQILFELNSDDALILGELSRSLLAVGDKVTLLSVLLKYYKETGDMETAKHACFLCIELQLYAECIEFVLSISETLDIEVTKLPIEILSTYTIASLYMDKDVEEELEVVWATENAVASMLYAVGTAWANRCQETALRWFKRGYDEQNQETIDVLSAEQAIHMAKCIVVIEKDHEMAIRLLRHILNREPSNSQIIILLADILLQAGKHSESDELLVRLTTTDLNRLKMIQKPLDPEERRTELLHLESTVQEVMDMCFTDEIFRPRPCLLAKFGNVALHPDFNEVSEKTNVWINRFLRVVNDCELDTERKHQMLNNTRMQKGIAEEQYINEHGDVVKTYSPLHRTRKDLGLRSVEDIIGWANYERLLRYAACLMAVVQRCREGVQLLEVVANNRRRYKSTVDLEERKRLLATVEDLSYQLSCFGGMFKIALAHAREEMAKCGNLKRYAALISTGALAKATYTSLSSSPEKDSLLENRSWIMRQILHKPQDYELLMLAGHFCTVSGNWPFAIEEYKRALIQRPNDPVAALCLATSYFNSLSSRNVKDLNKVILLGMTFLQYSIKLRKSQTENHPCRDIFAAESEYNMARAMHFLNLLHLAVPLYERCINTIKSAEYSLEGKEDDYRTDCPCIICTMSRQTSQAYPHSATGYSGGQYVWKYERTQLLRSAAYNLFLIYTMNKNTAQAAHVATHHLQWM